MLKFKDYTKAAITKIAPLSDSDIETVDGITTVTIDREKKVVSVNHLEDLSSLHTGYVCNTGSNEDYWYISDAYYKANYKPALLDVGSPSILTFGQKAVNVKFNPSSLSVVDMAKLHSAALIDLVEEHHKKVSTPSWITNVLRTAAFNAVITAQMAVVKYLTWEE